jgi:predicted metal-dependent phosphotriesterase family hydrolase
MSTPLDRRRTRREFVAIAAGAPLLRPAVIPDGKVLTVLGPVAPDELGSTMIHEHVLVDFIGADRIAPGRYDRDEVVEVVLPHLRSIRRLGCRTMVECTPAWLGRDPLLLRRLSEASGLHMVTNTGYYGAANWKYLPAHALHESAEQLAARWIREFRDGIEGTGVIPGFIKTGVNKGPLSAVDAKLIKAAALAHRSTGLTIACHTGDGAAAMEEILILRSTGVSPEALIWVHAQNESGPELHIRAAREGAWVEFESASEKSLPVRVAQVKSLIDAGFEHRALLSLDAGWYHVGEPAGGAFNAYDFFYTRFLPALRQAGITGSQIQQITVGNPRKALEVRVRR